MKSGNKRMNKKKSGRAPRRKLKAVEADRLVQAAQDARGRAYAPYSHYLVGAALLTADGRVFGGCNVENASYGLCLCAERGAIASAVSAGEHEFDAMAVVTEDLGSPCGACRQFLVEFNPEMSVILANTAGKRVSYTAGEMLPDFFVLRPEK
jgi:cytidine deaminase